MSAANKRWKHSAARRDARYASALAQNHGAGRRGGRFYALAVSVHEYAGRRFQEPGYPPTADQFVRNLAEEWGDRDLVVLGERRLTYRGLEAESRRLGRGLLASGVGPGSRVALLAPNGPEWLIGWMAAARVGALVVLLNTFHKAWELGWALAHCQAEVLLVADQYLNHDYGARLEQAVPGLAEQERKALSCDTHPSLRAVWMWGETAPARERPQPGPVRHLPAVWMWGETASARTWAGAIADLLGRAERVPDERFDAAAGAVEPQDPMVVIYTSGSTSEPKGVVHSHATVVVHPFNLLQFRDLVATDVLYTPMPLFWVGGLSYTLVSAMHVGAMVLFEERFEPGATLDLIERRRATHVIGWPHTAKALVEHPSFAARDLSSIRGGSFDELLPARLRVSDRRRRATSLGMTESLGPHSIEPLGVELPEGKEDSFGRSVPGIEHRIVDPETGDDLPAGETGEIWIRGYSLMLGLLGRDRAEVFEPGGWYRTSDTGRLDVDGHLYFEGRMGTVIKSAGTNVAPREVELAIELQPDVMHAFVVGVPTADGRGEAVAAAVVAKPGARISAEDLRARLRTEMAAYKVPRHVAVFSEQQDLPWLESGKIDLQALRRLLAGRFSP